MISFIIIGRNEGWKLIKCLESVYLTIEQNKIEKYEVIYVDSSSEDNSITNALEFNKIKIKIFKIIKNYNAGVARNIGAKESIGDTFFFIDGDMEINPDFLKYILNDDHSIKYDYVSGQLINKYHDENNNCIGQERVFRNLTKDRKVKTTGGIFLIRKKLWFAIGGMNNKYWLSQEDIDFGLRLVRKTNIRHIRKKEIITIHNTISYNNKRRVFQTIGNSKVLLFKGVLIRDHLLNIHLYKRLIRMDFPLLFLIVSIGLAISFHVLFLSVYFLVISLRTLINYARGRREILFLIILYIYRDLAALAGFFFFYPNTKSPEYISIKQTDRNR